MFLLSVNWVCLQVCSILDSSSTLCCDLGRALKARFWSTADLIITNQSSKTHSISLNSALMKIANTIPLKISGNPGLVFYYSSFVRRATLLPVLLYSSGTCCNPGYRGWNSDSLPLPARSVARHGVHALVASIILLKSVGSLGNEVGLFLEICGSSLGLKFTMT